MERRCDFAQVIAEHLRSKVSFQILARFYPVSPPIILKVHKSDISLCYFDEKIYLFERGSLFERGDENVEAIFINGKKEGTWIYTNHVQSIKKIGVFHHGEKEGFSFVYFDNRIDQIEIYRDGHWIETLELDPDTGQIVRITDGW